MATDAEYNPLDYANLTKNVVEELMRRGPWPLDQVEPFEGAGVYALFYVGDFQPYLPIRSPDAQWPIYVGKAEPGGRRKGQKAEEKRALYLRLREHRRSIEQATGTLRAEDFLCRYLVVTPLWITMAERLLIERFQPLWNVAVDGFGAHTPGKGREKGELGWWDVLHPGRPWASRHVQSRTQDEARQRVADYLQSHRPGEELPALPREPDAFMEDSKNDAGEDEDDF